VSTSDPRFDALFAAEYGPLHRTAYLIVGDDGLAHEIVQEAFTRALARWSRLADYERPGAWLRLVVVRISVRSRHRRAVEYELAADQFVLDQIPDADLFNALAQLSRRDRALLVLRYLHDMRVSDIADVLRARPGTVSVQLSRARLRLAAKLRKEALDVTT
jgi:RNA polymerase sigma-70 factor (ECF subfamily)